MKSNKIVTLVFAIILVSSCSESYFDKYPIDSLTETGFYTSKSNMEMALNDGYASLRDAYSQYLCVGDLASDNSYNTKFNNSSDNITINESNVQADNARLSVIWNGCYKVISRSNIITDKIGDVTMDDNLKNRYVGEAKFLRALMYFDLVRIFGSVPLVLNDLSTTAETYSYGQEPVDKIYEQIIRDLLDAESSLPVEYTVTSDIGRATSNAAKTLLGKVYLTRKDYQNAFNKLNDVVASGKCKLLNSYQSVFDASNANNSEIIFAVQYGRGFTPSLANPYQTRHFPNEQIGSLPYLKSGTGELMLTTALIRDFELNDQRKTMLDSLPSIVSKPRYVYFSDKYRDKGQTTITDSGSDLIVLRYADVLLMCAEAKNELAKPTEALPYVTQVRSRATLSTDPTIAGSQLSMKLAIEHERNVEFFSEGHRWFDLLRTGRLVEVMNKHFKTNYFSSWTNGLALSQEETGKDCTIEPKELIFPIPKFEVDLNPTKLEQNDGY